MSEGKIAGITLLVDPNRMAVAKGAAATILASKTDGCASPNQRGKGEVLAHAPVDAPLVEHLLPLLLQLEHFGVKVKSFGNLCEFLRDGAKLIVRNGCLRGKEELFLAAFMIILPDAAKRLTKTHFFFKLELFELVLESLAKLLF